MAAQRNRAQESHLDVDFEDGKIDLLTYVAASVSKATGVILGEKQRTMMESRLRRRISDLGLENFSEYHEFVKTNREETDNLVSLLTTHHTYFFREFSQFETLEKSLPSLIDGFKKNGEKELRIWSAACSRGQEVYSLGMFLSHHLPADISFKILGSDVCAESVQIARNGVYHRREVHNVPVLYLKDHWAKGTGEISDFLKVRGRLREACEFDVINLLNFSEKLKDRKFHIVFCRNVFIYLEQKTIISIVEKFFDHLNPGGQIFVGISESLHGLNLPVVPIGPSVYGRRQEPIEKTRIVDDKENSEREERAVRIESVVEKRQSRLRVLCVDDSPSVLAILKKVLSQGTEFEVVGTAKNGFEAKEMVEKLKPDVVTLDIHMPEQTGVEYLEKNFNSSHPPVVMVTAVSREDSELALRAFENGAMDYVEKPTLANMSEMSEELRFKLKCAVKAKNFKITHETDLGSKSPDVVKNPQESIRLVIGHMSDRERIRSFISECRQQGRSPGISMLIEGTGQHAFIVTQQGVSKWGAEFQELDSLYAEIPTDKFFVRNTLEDQEIEALVQGKRCSILVFGDASKSLPNTISKIRREADSCLVLCEEGYANATVLKNLVDDSCPYTSFAYLSTKFFNDEESKL